jgi:hypothetical protein
LSPGQIAWAHEVVCRLRKVSPSLDLLDRVEKPEHHAERRQLVDAEYPEALAEAGLGARG